MNHRKLRGIFERPPGSNIWWISYCADGRRHREKVGRRSLAIEVYRKRKTEIREGRFFPPRQRGPGATFRQLAELALEAKKGRNAPLSIAMDRCRLKVLLKEFGAAAAAAVTARSVDDFLTQLRSKGLSGSTANRYRSLLSGVFSFGVRTGRVQANPVSSVPRYKERPGRVRFLEAEEELLLRAVIRERCPEREPELDLALNTGMRVGEQYALSWREVDFDRRVLTLTATKNNEPRYLPLNSTAIAALRRLRSHGGPLVCPSRSPRGWFEICRRDAGLVDFTWHDLRHTFASRLVMAGVDLPTVKDLLGHKSIAMTMRYAHLSQGHRRAAVEKLDGTASVTGRHIETLELEQVL